MRILVFSISSPPEKTGIGKYNSEMIEYFGEKGHAVELVTTMPYYPEWEVHKEYRGKFSHTENKGNVTIKRFWSYLPKSDITSIGRIVKELTFFFYSLIYLLKKRIFGYSPEVLIYIAPPFFLPLFVRTLFKKSKQVYHIQDLEIDAAIELKMLPKFLETLLLNFERSILNKMDVISTISRGMELKIKSKNVDKEILLFPNWSDISKIYPSKTTWLHSKLNIDKSKKLIVYSGNIGNKQGLEILPSVITQVCKNDNIIHFVILGEGAFKKSLQELLSKVNKEYYTLSGLVEVEDLNKMLNSSFIQLVLQKAEGSDSFMPSKLTNILAAGIPSIVTALPKTGLFDVISENNVALTCNDNPNDLVKKIIHLTQNEMMYNDISINARNFAVKALSKESILDGFIEYLKKI